jgi:hypothetical protein
MRVLVGLGGDGSDPTGELINKHHPWPEIVRIFDFIEHVITICLPDRSLKVSIEDHVVLDKWHEMQAACQTDFEGVSSEEWEGWPRIAQLISEGRHVDLRIGTKEDHPKFWAVVSDYASEIVTQSEEEVGQGVDGTPVPFAPC